MSAEPAKLYVCVSGQSVWIRIVGRANFASSIPFKTLTHELRQRDCKRFAIDLTECSLMDSTFLGVLAGFGSHFNNSPGQIGAAVIELLNPNERVSELLSNLGVDHLFSIVTGPPYESPCGVVEALPHPDADHELMAQTSLEAHRTLMELDPANIPKFKDVAAFLMDDLERIKSKK